MSKIAGIKNRSPESYQEAPRGSITGPTGPSGGPTGPGGVTGPTGSGSTVTGPAGAAGGPIDFAFFYGISGVAGSPDYTATVAVNTAVPFPETGPAKAGTGITRLAAGTFTLANAGTYQITWSASVTEPGQLQVALNGTGVINGAVGRATGTSIISGNVVITATAGQVLSIINPAGSTTALTITPTAGDAGGSPAQPVVASLQIVRLA